MELRRWKGRELQALVKLKGGLRLEAAAIYLKNDIKHDLSSKGNIHGNTPSEPGESPAKVTGRLAASISHEISNDRQTARVGTNVVYGKFLEFGTVRMAARPWLQPAFNRNWGRMQQILKGKK